MGQVVGASVSDNLGSWFESLNKKLPERTIYQLLWQLKPEVAKKPDVNALKLIDGFQRIKLEAGDNDPSKLPRTRFAVKFLGSESRIAIVLTARSHFHQSSTSSFFVQKSFVQLFCNFLAKRYWPKSC